MIDIDMAKVVVKRSGVGIDKSCVIFRKKNSEVKSYNELVF